jgi:hypothetical protein
MWRQGQHVLIVGRTGQGKTYAARHLLDLREWIIALSHKRDSQVWWGWREVERAEQIEPERRRGQKWRLMPPKVAIREARMRQRTEFSAALERVWNDENWSCYVDELYYCETILNLGQELVTLWTNGRSLGITMVGGVQRPARINRFFVSESRYIICFRVGDGRDRAVLGEVTGDKAWAESLASLEEYQMSVYDKDSGKSTLGRASDLQRILG